MTAATIVGSRSIRARHGIAMMTGVAALPTGHIGNGGRHPEAAAAAAAQVAAEAVAVAGLQLLTEATATAAGAGAAASRLLPVSRPSCWV